MTHLIILCFQYLEKMDKTNIKFYFVILKFKSLIHGHVISAAKRFVHVKMVAHVTGYLDNANALPDSQALHVIKVGNYGTLLFFKSS